MERICEPELMDDPLQAAAYAAADFCRSDDACTASILRRLAALPAALAAPPSADGPAGGADQGRGLRIADLGCGPGNISFRLADALPAARLLGIDGAAAMLAPALELMHREPTRWPGLRLLRALLPLEPDAFEAVPADWRPPYQLVVSNSLLHHLHDPAVFWEEVKRIAAPAALLVLRDLRRPAGPSELEDLVALHAAAAPAVLRRDFSHSLRAAFTPEEIRAQLAEADLEGFEVIPVGDRHLEVAGRLL